MRKIVIISIIFNIFIFFSKDSLSLDKYTYNKECSYLVESLSKGKVVSQIDFQKVCLTEDWSKTKSYQLFIDFYKIPLKVIPVYLTSNGDADLDGVLNVNDEYPFASWLCRDEDGDSCDDCSVSEGRDYDGDGICDLGDEDIDGDRIFNHEDSDDYNPEICRDEDGDGCDDCSSGEFDFHNDGLDTDGDGLCDVGDPDIDNDGVRNEDDEFPDQSWRCRDLDGDGCDDCHFFERRDFDGDGICDLGDPDQDNDGSLNEDDMWDNDPTVCSDEDGDGCDDCSSGQFDLRNDGLDTDGDGICDAGDTDMDNDGEINENDRSPLDSSSCHDLDGDGCDECGSGRLVDVSEDGPDFDGDGLCDGGDDDLDGDGVVNGEDRAPLDPMFCSDEDEDGCDDCRSLRFDLANDGADYDGDGLCNAGDPDDDNDGAEDEFDPNDRNNFICGDLDEDGCDDCSEWGEVSLRFDGQDTDFDGLCDIGDPDDDGDGVEDHLDPSPRWASLCGDSDGDECDDCLIARFQSPDNDGPDADGDGLCDGGDWDDDNDYVSDRFDIEPNDQFVCGDRDGDSCDDCGVRGEFFMDDDGPDFDRDGLCDAGDLDDDNDGSLDEDDQYPLDMARCGDSDRDSCDDCSEEEGLDGDNDGICDRGDRQQVVQNEGGVLRQEEPINYGFNFLGRMRIKGDLVDYELVDVNGDGIRDIIYLENIKDIDANNVAPRLRVNGVSSLIGYGEDQLWRVRENNQSCGYAPHATRTKYDSFINIVFGQVGEDNQVGYDLNPVILPAGNFATDLIVGDVNGDQQVDLVTLNNDRHIKAGDELVGEVLFNSCYPSYGSRNIFIRENGNRNFYSSRQSEELAGCPFSGELADYNGDGLLDLSVTSNCRRYGAGFDRVDGYAQDDVRIYSGMRGEEGQYLSNIENSEKVYSSLEMQSRRFRELGEVNQADYIGNRDISYLDFINPVKVVYADFLGDGDKEFGIIQDHSGLTKYGGSVANLSPLRMTILKKNPGANLSIGEYEYLRTSRLDRGFGFYDGMNLLDFNGDQRLDYVLSSSNYIYQISQSEFTDYRYPTRDWGGFTPRTSSILDQLLDLDVTTSDVEIVDMNRDGHLDLVVSVKSLLISFRRELSDRVIAMVILGDENGLPKGRFLELYRDNENNFRDRVMMYELPEGVNFSREDLSRSSNLGEYFDLRVADIDSDGIKDMVMVSRFEVDEVVEPNREGINEPVEYGYDGYGFVVLRGSHQNGVIPGRVEGSSEIELVGREINMLDHSDERMVSESGSAIDVEDYPVAEVFRQITEEISASREEGRDPEFDNLSIEEIYRDIAENYSETVVTYEFDHEDNCFELQLGEEVRGFDVWYRMVTECWFNSDYYGEDPQVRIPVGGGGVDGGNRNQDGEGYLIDSMTEEDFIPVGEPEVISDEERVEYPTYQTLDDYIDNMYDDTSNVGVLLNEENPELLAVEVMVNKSPVPLEGNVNPDSAYIPNRIDVILKQGATVAQVNQILRDENLSIASMFRASSGMTLIYSDDVDGGVDELVNRLEDESSPFLLAIKGVRMKSNLGTDANYERVDLGHNFPKWSYIYHSKMTGAWNLKYLLNQSCNQPKATLITIDTFSNSNFFVQNRSQYNHYKYIPNYPSPNSTYQRAAFHGDNVRDLVLGNSIRFPVGSMPVSDCVKVVDVEMHHLSALQMFDRVKTLVRQELSRDLPIVLNASRGFIYEMPTYDRIKLDIMSKLQFGYYRPGKDQYLFNNPKLTMVVSVGNEGDVDTVPAFKNSMFNSIYTMQKYTVREILNYYNSNTQLFRSFNDEHGNFINNSISDEKIRKIEDVINSVLIPRGINNPVGNIIVVGNVRVFNDYDVRDLVDSFPNLSEFDIALLTYKISFDYEADDSSSYMADIYTQGENIPIYKSNGSIEFEGGSSLSTPQISGLALYMHVLRDEFVRRGANIEELNSFKLAQKIISNSYEFINDSRDPLPGEKFRMIHALNAVLSLDRQKVEDGREYSLSKRNAPARYYLMDVNEDFVFNEQDIEQYLLAQTDSFGLDPQVGFSESGGGFFDCIREDLNGDCFFSRRWGYNTNSPGVDLDRDGVFMSRAPDGELLNTYAGGWTASGYYTYPETLSGPSPRFSKFQDDNDLICYYAHYSDRNLPDEIIFGETFEETVGLVPGAQMVEAALGSPSFYEGRTPAHLINAAHPHINEMTLGDEFKNICRYLHLGPSGFNMTVQVYPIKLN